MNFKDLEIVYKNISELQPFARNPKEHPKKQVENIAKSIEKYGWRSPLLIDFRDGSIIAGHGRVLAAKKLGVKRIPCIDGSDMTPEQIAEYRYLDNKLNESAWDMDVLVDDLPKLDFSCFDIDWELPQIIDSTEVVEDDYEVTLPEEPNAKLGDIYQLGDHRLMCGDSTSVTDLEKLMGGSGYLADMVCTDPPYNMGYQGAGNAKDRASKRIMNDKMPDDKFEEFLTSAYSTMYCGMKDGASLYAFYKELGTGVFITALEKAGLTFKQEIIWVKNQLVIGGSKYQSMYEPCVFACKGKQVKNWNAGRKERSVIESIDLMSEDELRKAIRELTEQEETDVIRERKPLKNDLPPTMKPIKLLAKLIKNSSKKGEVVLDMFGGSGSTLIACEQLERKCRVMELDPKYVDVIIARWEDFTGKKAVLLSGN